MDGIGTDEIIDAVGSVNSRDVSIDCQPYYVKGDKEETIQQQTTYKIIPIDMFDLKPQYSM